MKRPAGFCCSAILAILLLSVMLPQVVFWLPAAFSIAVGLVLLRQKHKGPGLCLCIAGAAALLIAGRTLLFAQDRAAVYFGRPVHLQARVMSVGSSYIDGQNSAELAVSAVDGAAADFRVSCACLPACEYGEQIEAVFVLSQLPHDRWRMANYADGVFARAEYQSDFAVTAPPAGLRAKLHDLQQRLSWALRSGLDRQVGGAYASIVLGDARSLDDGLVRAYRGAGLSHILVVSGMHLSLLCGVIPLYMEQRRSRIRRGLGGILFTLFFMGLTGFETSIVRAGIAVLIYSVGLLIGLPADPFTSLALSGVLMCLGNAYAVWDVSFQLSFAATAGVLVAGSLLQPMQHPYRRAGQPMPLWCRLAGVVLPTAFAAVFTVPVLVVQGLNISLVAVGANLAAFWLIEPIVRCGALGAVCSLVPLLGSTITPLCNLAGGVMVRLLNALAQAAAALPGASYCPETLFPAIAVLTVGAFVGLAVYYKCPARLAVPAALMLLVGGFALDYTLNRDLIKIALVGNAATPAVVITQNGRAAVLYRGGYANAQEAMLYLEDRSIDAIDLVVDLRMSPMRACPLQGAENLSLARDSMEFPDRNDRFGDLELLLIRSGSSGGVVCMFAGDYTVWLASGTLEETTPAYDMDLLLASSGHPRMLCYCDAALTLSKNHKWLADYAGDLYYGNTGAALWLRPGKHGRSTTAKITGANQ